MIWENNFNLPLYVITLSDAYFDRSIKPYASRYNDIKALSMKDENGRLFLIHNDYDVNTYNSAKMIINDTTKLVVITNNKIITTDKKYAINFMKKKHLKGIIDKIKREIEQSHLMLQKISSNHIEYYTREIEFAKKRLEYVYKYFKDMNALIKEL